MTKNDLINLCLKQNKVLKENGIDCEEVSYQNVLPYQDDLKILGELTDKGFFPVLRVKFDGRVLYSNQAAHLFVYSDDTGKKLLNSRLCEHMKRVIHGDGVDKFKYIDEKNHSFIVKVEHCANQDFVNIYFIALEELRLDSDVLRAVVGHEFTRYTEDIEHVGIIEIDLTTGVAQRNRLFCDLNGVEFDGAVSVYNVFTETKSFYSDDVIAYRENMEDVFSGDLLGFESIYRINIGEVYYWRKATFHIRSNPNILIGTVEDIDREQRQGAEVAFLNSVIKEASFNSDFFYWSSTLDGIFQTSDSFESMTGLTMACSYRDFTRHIHPDDQKKHQEYVNYDPCRRGEIHLEYRFVKTDGDVLYFRSRGFDRLDNAGEVIGRVGIVVNVTSHVVSDERLRVNEHLLINAVQSSGMGYWIYQINTKECFFSDVFVDLFELYNWQEYSFDDNIIRLIDMVHPDDREMFISSSDEFFESGELERTFTLRVVNRNQDVRWIRLNMCVQLDEKLGVLYRFGTVIDITEQHRYEESLEKERVAAINANRAKSTFLATMSHEIRTPLNAIIGFSSLLKSRDLVDENLEYVKAINKSAESLLSILNDVLDFSKIEAKKVVLSPSLLSLDDFIEEVNTIFSTQAREKGLQLLTVTSQPGINIYLDVVRLRQIMFNIISNAFKFTEDGFISIDFEVVTDDADSDDVALIIKVRDSGIGISSKDLQNIFNVFEQAANQDVRKFGGTGLGLAISKNLVELMGGNISVESSQGIGTKFEIVIPKVPLRDVGQQVDVVDSARKFIKVKSRVVVVEKEREKLENICYYLGALGYKVERFVVTGDALECLKVTDVSLIVVDLMDGGLWNDLVLGVQKFDKHVNTPVVAISADLNAKIKYDLSFFNTVLYKPVVFSKFAYAIEHMNDKKFLTCGSDFHVETLQNIRGKFIEHFIERHKMFNLDYDIILSKELLNYAMESSDLELLKFANLFGQAVNDANLDLLNELSMQVLDNA